jgi:hypothetical protein
LDKSSYRNRRQTSKASDKHSHLYFSVNLGGNKKRGEDMDGRKIVRGRKGEN